MVKKSSMTTKLKYINVLFFDISESTSIESPNMSIVST